MPKQTAFPPICWDRPKQEPVFTEAGPYRAWVVASGNSCIWRIEPEGKPEGHVVGIELMTARDPSESPLRGLYRSIASVAPGSPVTVLTSVEYVRDVLNRCCRLKAGELWRRENGEHLANADIWDDIRAEIMERNLAITARPALTSRDNEIIKELKKTLRKASKA
ncbi:hypothetical protein PY365_32705 [Roseiarcaceae bacterium H3SJ34-1]|uniref:hypothetical protein n=1 Tax=Terripilifer ovatus TaxID=3032367 RepID=UPI003AB97768|nr:hypothetical protein [Roseiarcaceae bacterium H3SJ34-1]